LPWKLVYQPRSGDEVNRALSARSSVENSDDFWHSHQTTEFGTLGSSRILIRFSTQDFRSENSNRFFGMLLDGVAAGQWVEKQRIYPTFFESA
jgi:hypothetical protein